MRREIGGLMRSCHATRCSRPRERRRCRSGDSRPASRRTDSRGRAEWRSCPDECDRRPGRFPAWETSTSAMSPSDNGRDRSRRSRRPPTARRRCGRCRPGWESRRWRPASRRARAARSALHAARCCRGGAGQSARLSPEGSSNRPRDRGPHSALRRRSGLAAAPGAPRPSPGSA